MKGRSDNSALNNAMEQGAAARDEAERRRRAALTPAQREAEDKANRDREEQDKKDSERDGKIFVIIIASVLGLMFLVWLYDMYIDHIKPHLPSRRVAPADGGGGGTTIVNPMAAFEQEGGRRGGRGRGGRGGRGRGGRGRKKLGGKGIGKGIGKK